MNRNTEGFSCSLRFLSDNEFKRCSTGFTESLIAAGDSVVRNAGQEMLPAVAAVKKGSWDNPGRSGLIAMATLRLKAETVLHDGLPFRPVWPWSLAFCADLPVNNQMRDFVRDGLLQEIIEIFRK